jgi:hypothetical protein
MCAATVATVAAVAGTAYGAYSSNQQAQAAKSAAKKGATTNQTTTTTQAPWDPTKDPRQLGLDEAVKLYQSGGPKFFPGRPSGGGPSAATTALANDVINRGKAGSPTAQAANSYLTSLFANPQAEAPQGRPGANNPLGARSSAGSSGGGIDPNSTYNPELYSLMQQGAQDNPYLKAFLDANINTENNPGTGSTPAGMGGPNPNNLSGANMVFGANGSATPVGAVGQNAAFVSDPYIKDVLDGKFLNEGNPYTSGLVDQINAQITKAYNENQVPTINAEANAHGRFGSDTWAGLQANANGQFSQNLSTADSQVLQSDYESERARMMQALGLASGNDQAKMDDATKRAGIQASANSSAAGISAQLQAEMDQHNIERQQNLLSAIGQYSGDTHANQSYLAGLAQQLSSDRTAALGAVPAISNLDMNDLQTALATQKGLDAQKAAAAANQRNYDMQKWNFEQQQPYNNLSNLGKYINEFGGGFGTTTSHTEGQNVVPMQTPSITGSTIGGALQGYQTGSDLGAAFQQWYNNRQATPQTESTNLPTYPTPVNTGNIGYI